MNVDRDRTDGGTGEGTGVQNAPPESPAGAIVAPPVFNQSATEDTLVPAGVTCGQCRYELAGLDRTGLCPECGTPIRASFGGDFELYVKIEYLRGLAAAAQTVKRSIYTAVFATILCFGLIMVSVLLAPTSLLAVKATMMAGLGGMLLAFYFWWRGWHALAALGGPMPGVAEMQAAQRRVRIALAVQTSIMGFVLVIALIARIVEWTGGGAGGANTSAWPSAFAHIARGLVFIATAAAAVCGMQLVGRILTLFARAQDARAARRTGWSFAIALILVVGVGALSRWGRGAVGGPVFMISGVLSMITVIWLIAATSTLARCMADLELVARRALERANARNADAGKVV